MARLSPKSLFDSQSIELLYHQFADALATGPGELEIDLAEVKFARPHGVLALVNIARHWYEQGKGQTVLVNLFPTLHAYLERIDLFTAGDPYLVIRQNLPAEHRLSRTTVSANLLEMLPIRGASAYVEADCLQAIERAKYILDVWFPAHQTERYRLCLMLSEIAENIKHSQDRGFAIIQRYDGRGKSSKTSEVVIAVSDLGIGIEQSLISKGLHPPLVEGIARSGATYIQYAVQDYGACHDVQGQRGLHRVQEIVDEWRGRLIIRSSRSSVTWHKGGITMQDNLAFLPGTQVAITVREPGTHQQGTRA